MSTRRHLFLLLGALLAISATPCPTAAQERWTLRELQRRGEWEDTVAFGAIAAAAPGHDRLYVADGMNLEVVVLDSLLEPISRFGREGSGPGEFRRMDGLGVRGDTVTVLDLRLRRLSVLSASGEDLWTEGQPRPLAPNYVPPWPRALLADGSILVAGPDRGPPGSPEYGLHRLDRDSGHHHRLARLYENGEMEQVELSIRGARAFVELPFHGADRTAVSPDGELIALLKQKRPADNGLARVSLMALRSSGESLWTRELEVRSGQIPAEATQVVAELASEFAEDVRKLGIPRREAYAAYIEGVNAPRHQWAFDRLVVGRTGAVLLRRGSFGLDSAEWWRLVDGRVVATFSLPTSHEILAADGRRFWTRTRGELDEPILVLWRAEAER